MRVVSWRREVAAVFAVCAFWNSTPGSSALRCVV